MPAFSLHPIYTGFPKHVLFSFFSLYINAAKRQWSVLVQACFAVLVLVSSSFCSNYFLGLLWKSIAIIVKIHRKPSSAEWMLVFILFYTVHSDNQWGARCPRWDLLLTSFCHRITLSVCLVWPPACCPPPQTTNQTITTALHSDFSLSFIPPGFIMQHFLKRV